MEALWLLSLEEAVLVGGMGQEVQESGGMLVALVDSPCGNGGIKGRRELIPVRLCKV